MTEQEKTDAGQYATGTIEIRPDIVLGTKMRVAGILYLENKYDQSVEEIDFDTGRIGPVMDLLVAMMISHVPELDPDVALKRLATLDKDELLIAASKIQDAMSVSVKNGDEPAKAPAGDNPQPSA